MVHSTHFLCTAPDLDVEDQACWSEKALSVKEHLGDEWLKRLIITKDKTLVHGDYLIDDKPEIKGINKTPSWNRIVFHHEYNVNTRGVRLLNWTKWPMIESAILEYHSRK